jgi:hypothetical protein
MNTELLYLTPKEFCRSTGACPEGTRFALGHKSMAEVWDHCPRVDWLCWILKALDVLPDERAVRLYMVWCARHTPLADGRTTESLLTDPASREALVVAERFVRGEATPEELSAAWSAARSAAESAARSVAWSDWSAARSAAWSAAWSVDRSADWSAARSAAESAARSVAWSDWSVARSAAWSAAESAAESAQADQFRKVVPNPFRK